MSTEIKISDLEKSQHNARKSYSASGIQELKASILAHGLLHNLVVAAKGKKYQVVDGARRLEALQHLVKEKKLTADERILCEVISESDALEKSIAANTIREEMHPADEFEAFASLLKKDVKPAAIALRFGVTEKHVLQRLRLGQLSPELIKLFRAEEIDLETLMAFTLTDDHKKQMAVYKSLSKWERQAHYVRSRLMKQKVSSKDKLVKFVGIAAYEKAGGKITSDLFGEESFLDDSALLNKLAADKLNGEVEKLKKEGFAWVEASLEHDGSFVYGCTNVVCKTKEQRSKSGCYVSVDYSGKLEVERGLVKKSGKKTSTAKGSITSDSKKSREGISESLRKTLESYRLQIAQAEIATRPNMAFDILAFLAGSSMFNDGRCIIGSASINFGKNWPVDEVKKDETSARDILATIFKGLPMDWAKEKTEVLRFESFLLLSQEEKMRILAFAVSQSLKPGLSDRASKDDFIESAYSMMPSIGVSKYWRPTKNNYLSRITTAQLDDIGKQCFGKKWAPKSMNKAYLVTALHDAFKEPKKAAAGDAAIQAKLETWLPDGMAFAPGAEAKNRKVA